MSKREVFQLLINYYKKAGCGMDVVELVRACGDTEPANIMEGSRMFSRYLDFQSGGTI
ncbi:hypothetical protein [Domibacillus aminovorans]|uniref:hypothetical protein n=1 Tax=Domibacillus aminovorans TaxID=29332 RepID=UPI0012FE3A40|nr:hypothetical protein [Domibacillus aminovorans]